MNMKSFYFNVVRKSFFYRLLFFMVLFLLLLLNKDIQLIHIRKGLTTYNATAILQYFSYAIPEYLVMIFPLAFVLSFIWMYYILKKKNYLLYATLRGVKKETILYFLLLFYIPIAIGLFFLQQHYTKDAKKNAQIIMEDKLLKLNVVESGLDLYKNGFYRIDENSFLYFTRFVTDPPNDNLPYLTDVFYWVSHQDSDDFYVLDRATVENKNLILKDPLFGDENLTSFDNIRALIEPRHFQFSFDKNAKPSVNISELKKPIVISNFIKEQIEKNKTVHYSSLTITELLHIKKVISSLGMNTAFLWFLILLPFLHLFLLPVGLCFVIKRLFTFSL